MANQVYKSWLEHMMDVYFQADDHWTAAPMNLYVCGVTEDYHFYDTHKEVEDLGITVALGPRLLENVTTTFGVLRADNLLSEVPEEEASRRVHAIVLFVANDDGSRLIAYLDEGEPFQLPMRIVEGVFKINWGPNGILRI